MLNCYDEVGVTGQRVRFLLKGAEQAGLNMVGFCGNVNSDGSVRNDDISGKHYLCLILLRSSR